MLLAGDTFDTATPWATVIRQALATMAEAPDVTWWLLPGNHDNLRDAEPLWEAICRDAPGNVVALLEAAPHDLGELATLLPCPIAFRSGASDPSEPLVTDALGTQYASADLDEIDRGGALRLAANMLKEDAESDALSQQDRDVAADALARLYADPAP